MRIQNKLSNHQVTQKIKGDRVGDLQLHVSELSCLLFRTTESRNISLPTLAPMGSQSVPTAVFYFYILDYLNTSGLLDELHCGIRAQKKNKFYSSLMAS